MTVTAANVTIQAWGWTENDPFSGVADSFVKPFVKLNEKLHSITNNPTVITIASGADGFTIRGLEFEHSSLASGSKYSLGYYGAIIRAIANNCTVDDCEFTQIGYGSIHANDAMTALICSGSSNGSSETDEGQNLTVTGCRITDFVTYWNNSPTETRRSKETPIISGKNALVTKNIFEGCSQNWLYPRTNSPLVFSYNRVLNSVKTTIASQAAGGYNYVEMAHNIIVTTNSITALFEKQNSGLGAFKFHHNVVRGYTSLFYFNNGGWFVPTIYNNILLMADDGILLQETKGNIWNDEATVFVGNAWYSPNGFASGTTSVSNLGGMDAIKLTNPEIAMPSDDDFVTVADADVATPDYYRPYGNRLIWVTTYASADATHTPVYIGAQEPAISFEKLIVVNSFSVSKEEVELNEQIDFTVNFALENFDAGTFATVSWDFDGDGTIDQTSENVSDASALTISASYAKYGRYNPTVTISAGDLTQGPIKLTAGRPIKLRSSKFYVKANAPVGGDGSQDAPFSSLEVALTLCLPGSQVYVHGSNDTDQVSGVYAIASADDLMTVDAANVTIQPWEGTGTPIVEIDDGLAASAGKTVFVMTIASEATSCAIKDLSFVYTSGGLGTNGRLMSIEANNVLIENCSFTQVEGSTADIAGVIRNHAEEGARETVGLNMTVKGCYFKDVTSGECVVTANETQLLGNVYEGCGASLFHAVKQTQTTTGQYFVSNRVVRCTTGMETAGQFYHEISSPEIAYNIFVDSDVPFLIKKSRGMAGSPKIHHNTIVGLREFIQVEDVSSSTGSWTPQIFDNLIVLTNEIETAVIVEKNTWTTKPEDRSSSFMPNSFFRNNAWFADKAVAENTSTGYSLHFNFTGDGNIKLGEAPAKTAFVNTTDPWSPDFYRPKMSRNPTWTGKGFAWTGTGEEGAPVYPDYIGAVEPLKPTGFQILIR